VISYVEDVSAALSEIARVLRPGGRAVLQISNKLSPFEYEIRLRRFLASYASAGTRDGAEDRLRSSISMHAYRPSSFEAHCREFGFQKRDFRYYDFRLPVLGRLLPRVGLTIGKKLDRLSRSTLMGWIGAGYLVSLDKIDQKEEIGCSPCTKDRSGHRAW
jgi:SAM-dependent methyltransferase